MTMKCVLHSMLVLVLCSPLAAQATAPASTPRAQRVLIMSIDGGRPDVLLRADTPNVRRLCKQGSFTFWARTTELSVTLPSHASMITGVVPDKHGILFNKDVPEEELFYPKYPTIFELAKQQGLTTAMAAGKSKFVALCRPGSVDHAIVPPSKEGYDDAEVAQRAAVGIREHRPDVMLVHFGGGDRAGHALGWGTSEQIAAMEEIDAGIGEVVQALKDEGLFDSTLIILTADHGGAGRSHGKNDPRSRHIPWIAVGPGIRKNFDLTTFRDLVINTEDTFATACAYLNLTPSSDIDGKPITQMIREAELLQDVKKKPVVSAKVRPSRPLVTGVPATQPSTPEKQEEAGDYQNPYPPTGVGSGGFKLSNSVSAEFAVGSDICSPTTHPSDKSLPGWE